jgi:hypothetical protein
MTLLYGFQNWLWIKLEDGLFYSVCSDVKSEIIGGRTLQVAQGGNNGRVKTKVPPMNYKETCELNA